MVRLKIVSDIHLEFPGARESLPNLEPNSDILALLGDIGNPLHDSYATFLFEMSEIFAHVLVVAGNHEYYANVYDYTNKLIQHVCDQRENIHFLFQSTWDLDEFRFVGTTLWAQLDSDIQVSSTDHRKVIMTIDDEMLPPVGEKIENRGEYWDKLQRNGTLLSVDDKNRMHSEHRAFIERATKEGKDENKRIVVLTHHAPTGKDTLPYEVRNSGSAMQDSFTDLEELFVDPIIFWGFGHTHYNCDQLFGTTRVMSNQLGYVRRTNPTFNGLTSIKLPAKDSTWNPKEVIEHQQSISEIQTKLDKEAEEKFKPKPETVPQSKCILS